MSPVAACRSHGCEPPTICAPQELMEDQRWRDPIVEETRDLREEYAASLRHDPDAIFDDIRERQSRAGKKLVRYPPRKPTHGSAAA